MLRLEGPDHCRARDAEGRDLMKPRRPAVRLTFDQKEIPGRQRAVTTPEPVGDWTPLAEQPHAAVLRSERGPEPLARSRSVVLELVGDENSIVSVAQAELIEECERQVFVDGKIFERDR